MTSTVRRYIISPRKILFALLLMYAGIDYLAMRSMVEHGKPYVAALFFATLASWGLIEVCLHRAWRKSRAVQSDPAVHGEVLWQDNEGTWEAVGRHTRKLKQRRIFWPGVIMLLVACCCCLPGTMFIG
ncbi:MAG TPA: hypothetical protein VM581_03280 [Magnetospirillaceae bacterium]|nr:hypothetical protein [Magnetospirillaceae bacterium]